MTIENIHENTHFCKTFFIQNLTQSVQKSSDICETTPSAGLTKNLSLFNDYSLRISKEIINPNSY